mgnify:CR=1 FL=1
MNHESERVEIYDARRMGLQFGALCHRRGNHTHGRGLDHQRQPGRQCISLAEWLNINTSLAIYTTAFLVVFSGRFYQKGISEAGDIYFVLFSGYIYGYVEDSSGAYTGYRAGSYPAYHGGRRGGGICSGCYIISVFPTNPSDDLVVDLYERGMNLGPAKVFLDAVCVVLAFFCGEIGIGTIVCTFGLDPVIDMFHGRIRGKICVWLENGKVGKWFENRRNSVHLFFDSLYLRRNSSCASSSASLS